MNSVTQVSLSTVGRRIRAARKEKGLKQKELAEKVGRTRVTVTRWEGDETRASDALLKRIASVTGVTFEWLKTGPAGETPTGQPQTTRGQVDVLKHARTIPDLEPMDIEATKPEQAVVIDDREAKALCAENGLRRRKMHNDSMHPDIPVGSSLLCQRVKSFTINGLYFLLLADTPMVARVYRRPPKRLHFHFANEAVRDFEIIQENGKYLTEEDEEVNVEWVDRVLAKLFVYAR